MDAPQSPNPPGQITQPGQISQSDRSLVVMVRDGDPEAAALLYDRYAKRVLALVETQMGHQLRSRYEAEDIVQSVFKSMFRGVQSGNYDAPGGATMWNLIAVIAINKLRRHASDLSRLCRDSNREISIDTVDELEYLDAQSVEFFEASVREILEILRPFERTVLSMRLEQRTVEEISEQTGRSRRTVERSLQKGRQRLADVLLEETQE